MDKFNTSFEFSRRLAYVATMLAFIVVLLGAFTRLTDAGLGCPDWPGCYGQLTVPDTTKTISQADKLYPTKPVQPAKAWAEMGHRYVAGTLATLIFIFGIIAIINRHRAQQPKIIPALLFLLVLFQAALGMWTVTWQLLPTVVMGHLLGGMTILALLWVYSLRINQHLCLQHPALVRRYRFWAILGLIIVVLQIGLGGWTSANYASLACPDFPFCHGQLFPVREFHKAFNFFMPIGADFQGGLLDSAARITIQVMHRFGALITGTYWFIVGCWLLFRAKEHRLRWIAAFILVFLLLQICLGILNVVLMLPLPIAVMHNGMAALLLLAVVTLNYTLYAKPAR